MWLYGRNVAREILKNGKRRVYELKVAEGTKDVTDLLNLASSTRIPVRFVDRREIEKESGGAVHQGVAINYEGPKSFTMEEFLEKYRANERVTVAVLAEIEDPRNLGAIIRSCEIFGVCGIILTSKRSAPLNDAAFKASSGAIAHVDIVKVTNLNNALKELKEAGFWVYGFSLQAEKYLDETVLDKRSAIVLGSEGEGMRRLVSENCDFLLKIRQSGKLDSLNVSIAAAVAFYHAMLSGIKK